LYYALFTSFLFSFLVTDKAYSLGVRLRYANAIHLNPSAPSCYHRHGHYNSATLNKENYYGNQA